mgnify:CR=1 FL=1
MNACQIEVKVPEENVGDFNEFLVLHHRADSFQKIGNSFLVHLMGKTEEEIGIFVQDIQDVFKLLIVKTNKLCSGLCRDGTKCLNSAQKGSFCWKHN